MADRRKRTRTPQRATSRAPVTDQRTTTPQPFSAENVASVSANTAASAEPRTDFDLSGLSGEHSGDWVTEFFERFDALDAAHVAAGFPACSTWWRKRFESFLRSGKKRWVLRVGRRGGKSSTLSRLLVAW